jgi:hypothetical protein
VKLLDLATGPAEIDAPQFPGVGIENLLPLAGVDAADPRKSERPLPASLRDVAVVLKLPGRPDMPVASLRGHEDTAPSGVQNRPCKLASVSPKAFGEHVLQVSPTTLVR